VRRKGDIVELHRGRQPVVARRVLLADGGRVEEGDVGDEVGEEAEHVDDGEVDGRAAGGAAREVEEGLWVEGEGPGDGIHPAEEVGDGGEDGECHGGIIEM